MLNRITISFIIFSVFMSTAWAVSLDEAKTQGLVGEQPNGYLGFVTSSPAPDVKKLVAEINKKRKQAYKKIASKKNVALDEVEKISGEKAFSKTTKGNYIKVNGKWTKK